MTDDPKILLNGLMGGDFRPLARAISLVENEGPGYEAILRALPASFTPVIGITGPPGAGKSTLTDALVGELLEPGKRIAVLCIDPSSPFSRGALLGDRIRMSDWYTHPRVFIRSLASRGSLGGLSEKAVEICELLKAARLDYILVETVGVGQSELEIAGLADCSLVVLVPESGDEVQTMKAGLMEIADLFIVNKCDRPGADEFIRYLREGLLPSSGQQTEAPILKTVATKKEGITQLKDAILELLPRTGIRDRKLRLLAQRVYQIIRDRRMKDLRPQELIRSVTDSLNAGTFNLYKIADAYLQKRANSK